MYEQIIKYLKNEAEPKYKEFHYKLTNDNTIIGVRTPTLKKIAKYLANNNYQDFIAKSNFETYEEKVIYGLIIGYLKVDFNTQLEYLNDFMPLIDNWAINDIVCANLKSFKKNLDQGYSFIQKCLKSANKWQIRMGLVLLLDYYINKDYFNKIFIISNSIKNNDYYVKMANAWLISICYIKFPNETLNFIKKNTLDNWTHNKAIQKIIESKRIKQEEKQQLKKFKR